MSSPDLFLQRITLIMMIAMSVIPATAAITIHKVLFFRPPTTCAPAAARSGPELNTSKEKQNVHLSTLKTWNHPSALELLKQTWGNEKVWVKRVIREGVGYHNFAHLELLEAWLAKTIHGEYGKLSDVKLTWNYRSIECLCSSQSFGAT